jgi:hypothetical protein
MRLTATLPIYEVIAPKSQSGDKSPLFLGDPEWRDLVPERGHVRARRFPTACLRQTARTFN